MKACKQCGVEKPLDEFHNSSRAKDGKQIRCKPCNIDRVKSWQKENSEQYQIGWKTYQKTDNYLFRKRANKYGLTVEELKKLIENANGICEICKKEPKQWLVVDHCHTTSNVRGMLCGPCNRGLGIYEDNPELLKSAINYLNKHERP